MAAQIIKCADCKQDFEFSERDQTFYKEKNYTPPKRCRPCRDKRKADKAR